MATQKELAMQAQIDSLSRSVNTQAVTMGIYMKDAKEAHAILFKKLDDAQKQRSRIEIQTTKTNGRVNRMEDAGKRHSERLRELESDSKDTQHFKGKTGVIWGIAVTLIGGGILLGARLLLF